MARLSGQGPSERRLGAHLCNALAASRVEVFLSCDDATVGPAAFLDAVGVAERGLRAQGVGRGDKVWVVGGRGLRFWVDLVACWALEGVAVPVDPRATPDALVAMAAAAPPAVLLGGGPHSRAEVPAPPVGPGRAAAAVLFTSGSTGAPKGVVLSDAALLGNALATADAIPLGPGDRLAIALPAHFTSAICHFLAAALAGATLVPTERRLLAADLAGFVQRAGATWFGGAPLQARWLAECAPLVGSSLRAVVSSGDHLGRDVIALAGERLPDVGVYTVYGLTELGGRFCVLPPAELAEHAGSVGRPLRGMRVTVLSEAGTPAPVDAEGEVCAAGPYLFDGYLGESDPYAGRMTPYGFRTGDIGRLDADGRLRLSGRTDDVFKRSGEKVSAVRVLEALLSLDLFRDAAVVAEPDALAGHVPVAYVVLREGSALDTGAVLRALRGRVPAGHLPSRIVPLAEIPRTGSGKLSRRDLPSISRRGATEGSST